MEELFACSTCNNIAYNCCEHMGANLQYDYSCDACCTRESCYAVHDALHFYNDKTGEIDWKESEEEEDELEYVYTDEEEDGSDGMSVGSYEEQDDDERDMVDE